MNINQKIKSAAIHRLDEVETSSGAKKKTWVDTEETLDIAIYYLDEFDVREPFRYKNTSHVGLAYGDISEKKKEKALLLDEVKYKILAVNPSGRLVRYLLEEVDLW